ncbi:uncharacterized protein DSM5745_07273 [Aspergillus mulundensis]|uniref:Uncharacterized protein n=1 Tax=Aspergillus mulundensis TaxID=1810919 RepID=A0A3D8RLC4_9EURO|nr:hypothetical protein DSM5745_07273 [Aspergillus mulundensis]RDW74611.1 hypothetical protein DSM5745_07273 [Aspergillus mulundensis]
MENSDADDLLVGGALADPEFDENGFDTNEEVLLLRMMETNDMPVSPNLQAMLDDRIDIGWPSGQRQQSPLFIERPRSPGIDTAAFSFARPAPKTKPLSLQPIVRRHSSGAVQEIPEQGILGLSGNSGEGENDQNKAAAPSTTQSAESPTSPRIVEISSVTTERAQDHSGNLLSAAAVTDTSAESPSDAGAQTIQSLPTENGPDCNQQLPPEQNDQDMEPPADVTINNHDQPIDGSGEQPDNREETNDEAPSFEGLGLRQSSLFESRPNDNQWKVVKRRHSDKRKGQKRVSYALPDTSGQVPEEILFQQLISRLKAREESEAVATNLQKEMEANITVLKEENDALKGEVEALSSKLQKRTAETRAYKSQTESWKSKLGKIKTFFNDLGTDYQNLRGEAIHFKAARKTLDKERREIAESIEDVKAQMGRISQSSLEGRGETGSLVSSLKQELDHMRERVQYSQSQLVDEKRRSRLLELYIQNSSRAQDKKLDDVRAKQLEVIQRLESEFIVTSKNYESSHTAFSETFEKKVEEFLATVTTTTESLFNDRMDVQQCQEVICTFQSRMDTTTRQLGEDIGTHSKIAEGLVRTLEQQVQAFKDSVSDGSTLLEHLSANEDCCNDLRLRLEGAVPAFERLGDDLDGLKKQELNLGQRMESLETRLSEVKLPERFEADYFHISEKIGFETEIQRLTVSLKLTEEKLEVQQLDGEQKDQELRDTTEKLHRAETSMVKLESRLAILQERTNEVESKEVEHENEIQRLKLELKVKEERLEVQQRDNRQKHDELRELTSRAHQADITAAKLESQSANLQERIQALEAEAQDNIDKATTHGREQCSAGFERQLHELLMEKTKIEMNAQRTKEHLADSQQKLTEAEESTRIQCESLKALLKEREKRIQDLEASLKGQVSSMATRIQDLEATRTEQSSILAKREADIQLLREQEAALRSEQTSLREQLEEAQQRSNGFEIEFMKTTTEDQQSRKALQDSFSALQKKFTKKEENCKALQDSLSSIQNQLVEKEEECQRLQADLSAVQSELAENIEDRQNLQQGLSSLQDELARSKEECQGLQDSICLVQDELMRYKEERQNLQSSLTSLEAKYLENDDSHQNLQSELSSVRDTLAHSEEQTRALRKELEDANSARSTLESGKSKAKAEIHSLLKRVQDSESVTKTVKETLHQMGISRLEQPLSEALNQLERVLQTKNARQPTTAQERRLSDTPVEARNPRTKHKAHTTEVQTDPRTPVSHADQDLSSKRAGNIVPFSSILEGLSPVHQPAADSELFDLSALAHTPKRAAALQEPSAPSRPEKYNPPTDKPPVNQAEETGMNPELDRVAEAQQVTTTRMQRQGRPSASIEQGDQAEQTVTGRKVSFASQKLAAEEDVLQVPDPQNKDMESNVLESSINEGNITRTNRWTYSKRQRETSVRQQETTSIERIPSQVEEQETRKLDRNSMIVGEVLPDWRLEAVVLRQVYPILTKLAQTEVGEGQDVKREVTNTMLASAKVSRSDPNWSI